MCRCQIAVGLSSPLNSHTLILTSFVSTIPFLYLLIHIPFLIIGLIDSIYMLSEKGVVINIPIAFYVVAVAH